LIKFINFDNNNITDIMTENIEKPLILISNDDGADAPGLHYLIDRVRHLGDIIAVAPKLPQSGMSSAITVNNPLRINLHEDYNGVPVYSVTGTPVDCVKLALHTIVPRRPDVMLSGVNHGSNSGNSVIYSGTMGATMEAAMTGIPSVGYSLLHHSLAADFSETGKWIELITKRVMDNGLPDGICLNVNFPAKCKIEGIKTVRAARGYWTQEYTEYTDPHGKPFYWLTGRFHNIEPDDNQTDEYWLAQGYGSVVPVRMDQSATDAVATVSALLD